MGFLMHFILSVMSETFSDSNPNKASWQPYGGRLVYVIFMSCC